MSQILGVKFTDYGQVYYFSSGPFVVREGQSVIVNTEQGMGLGRVVLVRQDEIVDPDDPVEVHKPIYRLANEEDMTTLQENEDVSKDAFTYCKKCIENHKLGMKLVDVEVFFDRSKMIFYFTAPGRIDFRELIKDLVREYRTRIELRQIGVRHETQMIGAIGNCGQLCCCNRFLRKFMPVTIKMAKEQNLFLNPAKISGICGRLLCCLSYEQEGYEEFHRLCPKVGKRFETNVGNVRVVRSNFFKKTLTLVVNGKEEKEIPLDDWEKIRNGEEYVFPEADASAKKDDGPEYKGQALFLEKNASSCTCGRGGTRCDSSCNKDSAEKKTESSEKDTQKKPSRRRPPRGNRNESPRGGRRNPEGGKKAEGGRKRPEGGKRKPEGNKPREKKEGTEQRRPASKRRPASSPDAQPSRNRKPAVERDNDNTDGKSKNRPQRKRRRRPRPPKKSE
ncbi:MAG: PSP1 domain-containing protein [Desulfovibrio sp.]